MHFLLFYGKLFDSNTISIDINARGSPFAVPKPCSRMVVGPIVIYMTNWKVDQKDARSRFAGYTSSTCLVTFVLILLS